MTTEQLVDEARKLSPAQRIDLIETILATLTEPEREWDTAWVHEAEDRVAAYLRGNMQAVDFDEALAKHDAE